MQLLDNLPPTSRRVELHTRPSLNEAILAQTDQTLMRLQSAPAREIDEHLQALDREWDVERALQTNAPVLCLLGLALGVAVDRRFLLLPAAVFGFFGQHALQGWCPPIPIFRRLGVRTLREIERERYALKALRGDFDGVPATGQATPAERVRAALSAVDA
jgi:hypothetical protein